MSIHPVSRHKAAPEAQPPPPSRGKRQRALAHPPSETDRRLSSLTKPLQINIFSFLDIPDLGRMCSVATTHNRYISQDAAAWTIWYGLAHTFSVSPSVFPKVRTAYSKATTKEAIKVQQQLNTTFDELCKTPETKRLLLQYIPVQTKAVYSGRRSQTGILDLWNQPLATGCRMRFKTHIILRVSQLSENALKDSSYFSRLAAEFFDAKKPQKLLAIINLFFACGEYGNGKTLKELAELMVKSIDWRAPRPENALNQLQRFAEEGHPPDNICDLFWLFERIALYLQGHDRLIPIVKLLLERGAKIPANAKEQIDKSFTSWIGGSHNIVYHLRSLADELYPLLKPPAA